MPRRSVDSHPERAEVSEIPGRTGEARDVARFVAGCVDGDESRCTFREWGGTGGPDADWSGYFVNQPSPSPPDISGTWASACVTVGTQFQRITVVATADRWSVDVETFRDACAVRTMDLHLAGTYALGPASTVTSSAWEGSFVIDTRELTADDRATARRLARRCRLRRLRIGTRTRLDDHGCAALGVRPAATCAGDYDLVGLDGDLLRFGVRPADGDLCTADRRPIALDDTRDLAYVWKPTGVPACDTMLAAEVAYARCTNASPGWFDTLRDDERTVRSGAMAHPARVSKECTQTLGAVTRERQDHGC